MSADYVVKKVSANVKELYLEAILGNGPVSDAISRSFILNPREKPPTRVWRDLKILEYQWSVLRNGIWGVESAQEPIPDMSRGE